MATITGKDGIIKIDDVAIVQLRSWSLDKTGDTVEDSVIGDDWRTFKATMKGASGSCEMYYDESDLAIDGLEVGATVDMELYTATDNLGATFEEFSAIVTGLAKTGSFDGMTEKTMSFQVTGAVTESVVPEP